MERYFGDFTSIVSTIMVLMALAFVVYSAIMQKKITKWGRRTAALAVFGLILCCFVATRDGYVDSIRSLGDPTVSAGLFAADSLQSTLCSIGGAILAAASISSIFVKSQKYRKIAFFILGGTVFAKTLIIEISRLAVTL